MQPGTRPQEPPRSDAALHQPDSSSSSRSGGGGGFLIAHPCDYGAAAAADTGHAEGNSTGTGTAEAGYPPQHDAPTHSMVESATLETVEAPAVGIPVRASNGRYVRGHPVEGTSLVTTAMAPGGTPYTVQGETGPSGTITVVAQAPPNSGLPTFVASQLPDGTVIVTEVPVYVPYRCSVGWVLFGLGFIFPLLWLVVAFLPSCSQDMNDRRASLASCLAFTVFVFVAISVAASLTR